MNTERHKLKVATYALLIRYGSILLSRRFQTGWQDGSYSLPAGHLDPHETIAQAAMREAHEEVGVTLRESDLCLVHTMHRMDLYIDFFFVAESWEGTPENNEPDKCDDVRWFPLDELPPNMVPSVRHAIGQYLRGIAFSEFQGAE